MKLAIPVDVVDDPFDLDSEFLHNSDPAEQTGAVSHQ